MRTTLWVSFGAFLAGCGTAGRTSQTKPQVSYVPAPAEAWAVMETDPNRATPAVLWNGLIGLRLGRSGIGLDGDGKPLPMFDVDEYDVEGEEKIHSLVNALQFRWSDGRPLFTPASAGHYRQRLDFRTGKLTTSWESSHPDLFHVSLTCEVVLHPAKRIIGVRWTMEADHPRPKPQITASMNTYRPDGQPYQIGKVGGSESEFWLRESRKSASDGGSGPTRIPHIYEAVFSIGRSPQARRAFHARFPGILVEEKAHFTKPEAPPSFADVEKASTEFYSGPSAPDIEIDGPVEDQQALRSFFFYLRSAVHPEGSMSVAPMGLSSQTYNGHVFWDADIWVFPALALIEPERAKAIAKYRESLSIEAMRNASRMFPELRGPVAIHQYPWESSVTGREVAPPSHRREFHISGSVAWCAAQAGALGLLDKTSASLSAINAANFYGLLSIKGPSGESELRNVMSPDENHTGDNDLYTNLLAQWCVNNGSWTRRPGSTAPVYKLPRDEMSLLSYDNDPVRSYKQAAAVLAIYPLQFPEAEKQAKVMMDRFADKVSKNGPAMSDSVHALIWARLGEKDRAYETWRKSWQDFTQHPLLLFSEKRSKENTYFVTGAGGCLQTVLYGFLGLRIDEQPLPGADWTLSLRNGRTLSLKPNLPPAWKKVTFKNLSALGKRFDLEVTAGRVAVTPKE